MALVELLTVDSVAAVGARFTVAAGVPGKIAIKTNDGGRIPASCVLTLQHYDDGDVLQDTGIVLTSAHPSANITAQGDYALSRATAQPAEVGAFGDGVTLAA
jgi:hypothetical protein